MLTVKEHKPPTTKSEAYWSGRRAWDDKVKFDDCPLQKGKVDSEKRKDWFVGWLDAEYEDRFRHLVKK